jgi:xylulose-5-phosphate/fructose-6-phosphate phosphoketolase
MTTAVQDEVSKEDPLDAEELRLMNAWWRACNYLSVGMIYLRGNPLLREPLEIEHIKHRLLGHWGARHCRSSGCI